MKLLNNREPYSYRADPDVPAFDDGGPVTFMDGECVLCTFGAKLIARFDTSNQFKICHVQPSLGQSMLAHYELAIDDPSR